jgi:hypothetical protein
MIYNQRYNHAFGATGGVTSGVDRFSRGSIRLWFHNQAGFYKSNQKGGDQIPQS